jgi:hypothetical protein
MSSSICMETGVHQQGAPLSLTSRRPLRVFHEVTQRRDFRREKGKAARSTMSIFTTLYYELHTTVMRLSAVRGAVGGADIAGTGCWHAHRIALYTPSGAMNKPQAMRDSRYECIALLPETLPSQVIIAVPYSYFKIFVNKVSYAVESRSVYHMITVPRSF